MHLLFDLSFVRLLHFYGVTWLYVRLSWPPDSRESVRISTLASSQRSESPPSNCNTIPRYLHLMVENRSIISRVD